MAFDELSNELLDIILSFLDPVEDYQHVRILNHHLKSIIDELAWKRKFKEHFPFYYPCVKNPGATNWHNEYAKAYTNDNDFRHAHFPKILYLVKEGNLDELKKCRITYEMLAHRENVNCKYSHSHMIYRSMIAWALAKDDQAILDYFYGIAKQWFFERYDPYRSFSFLDDEGRTADRNLLHWAVACRQPMPLIRELFTKCEQGRFDESLLRIAIDSDHMQALNFFIDKGYTKKATECLCYAVANNKLEITRKLVNLPNIQINKDIYYAGNRGSPLLLAVFSGNVDIAALLFNNPNINPDLDAGVLSSTPLLVAIGRGDINMVNVLITHGADLNIMNYGETPLAKARKKNHIPIMNLLLSHGAKVSGVDLTGADLTQFPYFPILPLNERNLKIRLDRLFYEFNKHPQEKLLIDCLKDKLKEILAMLKNGSQATLLFQLANNHPIFQAGKRHVQVVFFNPDREQKKSALQHYTPCNMSG